MENLVSLYDSNVIGGDAFQRYISHSQMIGGVVNQQAQLVHKAFLAQREFIAIASKCSKPKTEDFLKTLLKTTSDNLIAVQEIPDKNRTSEFFNHISAVGNAIPSLGWVLVLPDPSKYVKELHGASAYYAHKVIVANKDKNPTHTNWANAWLQVLLDLHTYIFENHRCGLQWNLSGPPAAPGCEKTYTGGPPPPPTGGPPPPPPPPPELFDTSTVSADNDARLALFKEINQGAGITKCLKKMDKCSIQQTNPIALQSAKYVTPTKQTKPPKFELDGRKWCVEYQQKANLKISETSMNQTVVIYQCHNCVIQVENKVNCITLDSCKKTSVVFADIVSFVEFINCQDMKAQAMGVVPTITLDKTDGLQVFLNEKSIGSDIISSKSSELNLCLPTDDGDYKEYPVPEQFKTTVLKNGLKTVVVEKM